ncbi:MAG: 1-deoxy-D-xylulose-5-phosphate synthase [Alphaproteobacteria bacterium]|nr:1-deoxy-D-xylulose-5-phosphate synthase [Alphaproteobacteria bacterium]OJV13118.1 MAG: 1-deoxy-D-xylulose-5-phosphate synthase [Alphaproteobacteria bacterium 33-17]
MQYSILDKVKFPSDIRSLSIDELKILSNELRQKTIEVVSETGGHLGAGLGVIELTIALHYVFDTPNDRIVWDIGHQTYPHKIITGRKAEMLSLRQKGGLSGFTKRKESEYDHFGAGHSSTSISAALGMAVARDIEHKKNHVVAVIGDGSISAGMAYEALNNAGYSNTKMLVILNNNDMSIAAPTGAMSKYLSRISSSKPYLSIRNVAKHALEYLPESVENFAKKTEQFIKKLGGENDIFEDLGFYSIGPIDGHSVETLVSVLTNIRDDHTVTSPFLLHIVTEKGKGFNSPDSNKEKYHAVQKYSIDTLEQTKVTSNKLSYTKVFAESMIKLAETDEKVVAITAAMPSGTGLDSFAKHFPKRMFDVGIAEQHAVTFAAGLACEGIKPFCALYSTFLQRGYDQVIHDVSIQDLPVKFAIDRAGFVGADGPTHAGSFDMAFLGALPNMVILCPSDGNMLIDSVYTANEYNEGAIAFRYPRGNTELEHFVWAPKYLEIGKGRYIRKASGDTKIALVTIGTILDEAVKAAKFLEDQGLQVTIFDAIYAKPIDKLEILEIAKTHDVIITIEEGSIGGFASQVSKLLTDEGCLDNGKLIFRSLMMPDAYIDQATQSEMLKESGLDSQSIAEFVVNINEKIAKLNLQKA